MLSVLIEGTLIAAPVQRTSAKGTPFVTARLRCSGEDGQSILWSVIAFQASAAEGLATLAAGDTAAVAGLGALSQWEKDGEHHVGLKVTASRVLTVYDAGMRRKAASQKQEREAQDGRAPASPSVPSPPPALPGKSRPSERFQPHGTLSGLVDMDNNEPV